MERSFDARRTGRMTRNLLGMLLVAGILWPLAASPANVALATSPLANSTTSTVLPNLMFVLDGSGSMGSNFLPDWSGDKYCLDPSGGYTNDCNNQVPFQSPDWNGVYYNPAIAYKPPVKADGTSYPSMASPWTSVKNDAWNVQDTNSTNLVSGYIDIEWCTDNSYSDCLRNDNYLLPGVVSGKSYKTEHVTVSTGSGYAATGSPTAPTISARTWGPHYYVMVPGEWCDTARLKNCQTTADAGHTFPAKLRWCTDASLTTCQSNLTSSYNVPRFPAKVTPASATLTVSGASSSTSVTSVKVNGLEILSGATSGSTNTNSVATRIATAINSCTITVSGSCAVAGYSASASGGVVTIVAPMSFGAITYTPVVVKSGSKTITASAFSGFAQVPGTWKRVDIVSGTTSYPYPGQATKASTRTDCAGATCTYSEEMTNFANWWTYYQTRMQTMKTAVSQAFKPIDNKYRVGFIDLWGNNYLPIQKFDAGVGSVKANWYTKLFSIDPNANTPLRSALARVGRIYAGKNPTVSPAPSASLADPVQYSCQQNFTLMTTDGYWNNDTDADVKDIAGTGTVGNMDSDISLRSAGMYEGPTATSNTLADVAKYYYDTDLRNSSLGNCTSGSSGLNVCADNVFVSGTDNNVKQHMTTFTLGLGVDGELAYTSDYKTNTSGDFYSLTHGLGTNWPVPGQNSQTAVDDLWHAAVNGRGTYFSAKDPNQLTNGLNTALASINSKLGAGAAAATSTLNPVAGNNYAYVASYTTVKWQGNLEARTINISTGAVSESATWCAEDVVQGNCPAPGSIVADTSGAGVAYNCVTPGATAATCGGTLSGSICTVEMVKACTGTMAARQQTPTTDNRKIYFKSSANTLLPFTPANISSEGKSGLFSATGLSQYTLMSSAQQSIASGANMVNYLRGQTGFDDRVTNLSGSTDNRLYRYREATLGDAVESQPAFVGPPEFTYTDAGYAAFVTAQASRLPTVYIGTNDGMMHAFDAANGVERWAFIPTAVMGNMWKLADKNYATMHTNYVNGKPVIADIYTGGAWKTILVAGLNGGGQSFYALDITDPTTPVFLWEVTTSTLPNLGYSYGPPVVTKKSDGTWIVLLTSGYDNGQYMPDGVTTRVPAGDGKGYLFVRNAYTGAAVSQMTTGAGDAVTPSGLGKVSSWADLPTQNNQSLYVYGGDLLGNLWRFDINANTVLKFSVLKDASGVTQAITTAPELGRINGKRYVFVGTGKYLETADLVTSQTQSLYAIQDDDVVATLVNPRTLGLQQQVLSTSGATRTASTTAFNISNTKGWYIDFPDTGERVNIDPILDSGLLIVPTTVPSNTICSPGGYGWLNYFNYASGNNGLNQFVSQKYNAPIVGINVLYTADGKRHVSSVTADNPTPEEPNVALPQPAGGGAFTGKRVIWRELAQ
jgi:type IV pilus assembly protein PilY1